MTKEPSTEELLASLNKPLPFSDDDERGLLSCILQRPNLIEEAPPPEQMYHEANRVILATLLTMRGLGMPLDDPISLTRMLREAKKLEIVGGAAGISELFSFVPVPSHWPHYLKVVREKFQFRQMIGALAAGIAHLQAFTGVEGGSATDALEHCQKLVCEAANDAGEPDLEHRPIGELLADVVDGIEERCANPGRIPGISTGFVGLDKYLGGLEPGRLTVIAGESSDGKSCLARQMVESACMLENQGVIYSYEMRDTEEAGRILCAQAGVDSGNLKHGMLTRGEQMSLSAKMGRIAKWPIAIVDVAGKTIEQICRDIARRSKKLKQGQKLVASIDYIQLCLTTKTNSNREREVAHITATAKQCAKMTGAHIIMPSQLNEDGKVRESRAIEQDADNLIIIQKSGDKGKPAWQKKPENDEPNFERDLFIKKNRNGERLKIVKAVLNGRYFRFDAVTNE